MTKVFLHSAVSLSAQKTFDAEDFLAAAFKLSGKTAAAIYPNYKHYIAPSASRRMATGVKMGVTAARKALEQAHVQQPDAIITGTGMGCIEDTEKFLNSIIANDEKFLTPTSFIQSTHNTVGAQIALGLKCKAYNNTYVHASISFESALLDAQLLLEQEEAQHVLVGGVDELGKEIVHHVRMMEDADPQGMQVPIGEGATFFVLSSEPTENALELIDVHICNIIPQTTIQEQLCSFLRQNAIDVSDIDVLLQGRNGDRFDRYYDRIASLFDQVPELHYKHVSGEYYTASAFGLWTAYQVLNRQMIPDILLYNSITKQNFQTVLLYNQFKGRDHSFILLRR